MKKSTINELYWEIDRYIRGFFILLFFMLVTHFFQRLLWIEATVMKYEIIKEYDLNRPRAGLSD